MVTDPPARFVATTEWLVDANAIFAAAEIDDPGDFVRISKLFAIATSYKMGGQ